MKKRFFAVLLVVAILLSVSLPAFAASAKIKKTEYEGNGFVDVDFKKNVQYKNVKVTVKDSSGKSYSASIQEKDNDDLTFYVKDIKAGTKYSYTISGIRAGKSGSYGKVSGSFKTPGSPSTQSVAIKKVDFDADDREIEVEFTTKVQFKSAKVTVKDSSGKSYTTKIRKKGDDDIEVYVKGMKNGKEYTVTVSGVRVKGSGSYTSVSKTFTAWDD